MDGAYTSSRVNFNYAPRFELFKLKISIQPGFQLGYISTRLDYSRLSWGDMIDERIGFVYQTNEGFSSPLTNSYVDLSCGVTIFNNNFWAGAAVQHLTQPNESFVAYSELPIKLVLHGGYNIPLTKDSSKNLTITPTILYQQQSFFQTLLPGVNLMYKKIFFGLSYLSNDALITALGYQNKQLRLAYSYDYTTSKLGNSKSGGSHELGIIWFMHLKTAKRGAHSIRIMN